MDFTIRRMAREDVKAIVEIDALHTGEAKPEYWHNRLQPLFAKESEPQLTLGYVAVHQARVIGYVLAEGRAWEFGSPLCGWIVGIGVHPDQARKGIAQALCREVCLKLRAMGIHSIRTMVRKDDVGVLSFFRAFGFRAGPFIELELEL